MIAASLAASAIMVVPALAQVPVPVTPGQYMAGKTIGALGELAAAIGELSTANLALEDELIAARKAFFEAPPGPQRAPLGRKFDEAMMKRDLHFVALRIINDGGTPRIVSMAVGWAGSNSLDGGISPYSYQSFKEWADFVINAVEQRETLEKALGYAMPTFEKYRVERDIVEELFYNPRSVLRAADPKPSEYLAAWILGTKHASTFEAANASAAKIARTVGPERLEQIVQVLRSWSVIDNQITAPGGWNPASALDNLVAGKIATTGAMATAERRSLFAQMRYDMSRWHTNFVPQLDEMQRAWNQARARQDVDSARLAVQKRDELFELMREAHETKLSAVDKNMGVLLLSRLQSTFSFVESGVRNTEFLAMSRGEMNSLEHEAAQVTREYLAKSSKLQSRTITAQERMLEQRKVGPSGQNPGRSAPGRAAATPSRGEAVAPVVAGTAVSAGASPSSPGFETNTPFDRAIALAMEPDLRDQTVLKRMFEFAVNWEYQTETETRPEVRLRALQSLKQALQYELGAQSRHLKGLDENVAKMDAVKRERYEKTQGRRDAARKRLVAEMEALVPVVEKAIASAGS